MSPAWCITYPGQSAATVRPFLTTTSSTRRSTSIRLVLLRVDECWCCLYDINHTKILTDWILLPVLHLHLHHSCKNYYISIRCFLLRPTRCVPCAPKEVFLVLRFGAWIVWPRRVLRPPRSLHWMKVHYFLHLMVMVGSPQNLIAYGESSSCWSKGNAGELQRCWFTSKLCYIYYLNALSALFNCPTRWVWHHTLANYTKTRRCILFDCHQQCILRWNYSFSFLFACQYPCHIWM